MKVFVYGTLMAGYGNSWHLESARLVGAGETVARCRLYHAGFPVLRRKSKQHAEDNAPVRGEVWEVTDEATMQSLDSLEGEGRMYHRRVKLIRLDGGAIVKAFTYVGDTKFWRSRRVQLYPIDGTRYSWPAGRKALACSYAAE